MIQNWDIKAILPFSCLVVLEAPGDRFEVVEKVQGNDEARCPVPRDAVLCRVKCNDQMIWRYLKFEWSNALLWIWHSLTMLSGPELSCMDSFVFGPLAQTFEVSNVSSGSMTARPFAVLTPDPFLSSTHCRQCTLATLITHDAWWHSPFGIEGVASFDTRIVLIGVEHPQRGNITPKPTHNDEAVALCSVFPQLDSTVVSNHYQ